MLQSRLAEEIQKVQERDEKFTSSILVEFFFEQKGIFADDIQVQLSYDLTVGYASWGINYIDVSGIQGPEVVEYATEGVEDVKTLLVDWEKVKIDWTAGKGYHPVKATLWVNAGGHVDYTKSVLEFDYFQP